MIGWGLGDLDTESHICKHICVKANVCVIDVAYRLVPEFAFPIGIQDSFAALEYISAHGADKFNIDPTRVSLGGVSAGGNIALICAHLARDAKIPLKLVAVGTPTIDDISKYKSAADAPWPSMQDMEHAPTLNWARLKWFDNLKWQSIAPEGPTRDAQLAAVEWYANALQAPDFTGLPKTVIYTAGCDPLRDEGEAYARKLIEGGNEVIQKRFAGVPHPFMHMDKGEFLSESTIVLHSNCSCRSVASKGVYRYDGGSHQGYPASIGVVKWKEYWKIEWMNT
jgi:acetyl esterase/lipase